MVDPRQAGRRYTAIEEAYCDDRWSEVLERGQALRDDLATSLDPTLVGLRQRVELLLAHSHLYGLGDRKAARNLYESVLNGQAEATLTESARQGLELCQQPEEPVAPAEPAPATATTAAPATAAPATVDLLTSRQDAVSPSAPEPAMPWASAGMGATSAAPITAPEPAGVDSPDNRLVAEVVEEPELIELHQSDPTIAEELELEERPLGESPSGPAEGGSRDNADLFAALLGVEIR